MHRVLTLKRLLSLMLGLSLLGMGGSVLAAGAAYKWTDAQGTTHYDDQNAASGQRLTREYINQRQVQPAEEASTHVPKAFAQEVADRCALARERESSFGSAGRVYVRDGRGLSRPLSVAQAAAIRGDIRREIQRVCASDAAIRLYQGQSESTVAPAGRSYNR